MSINYNNIDNLLAASWWWVGGGGDGGGRRGRERQRPRQAIGDGGGGPGAQWGWRAVRAPALPTGGGRRLREFTGTRIFQLSEQNNVIIFFFFKSQYQLHYQQFRVTIFKVSIAKEGSEAVRAEPE